MSDGCPTAIRQGESGDDEDPTTHVGSLPRSQKVVDFIFAREREEPYDPAAFDACMTEAVAETVRSR
jgi:methionine synthase II (cobalamin-independent)